MFKSILSLFLLVFTIAIAGQSFAAAEPTLPVDSKLETDSTTVKNKHLMTVDSEKQVKVSETAQESKTLLWQQSEEVEEDSTSNSALSFNFIYYIIEKFKFQVE